MSDFTLSPPYLGSGFMYCPPSSFSAPPPDNYCTVPKPTVNLKHLDTKYFFYITFIFNFIHFPFLSRVLLSWILIYPLLYIAAENLSLGSAINVGMSRGL